MLRTTKKIAMLKRNMQQIFIDEQLVLEEYLKNDSDKLWNKEETEEDKASIELESELYNEDLGLAPDQEPDDDDALDGSDVDNDDNDSDSTSSTSD